MKLDLSVPLARSSTSARLRRQSTAAGILTHGVGNDINVIGIDTHGRTGYERHLLASIAKNLVRAASIAVLVIAVGDTVPQREDIATVLEPDSRRPGVDADDGVDVDGTVDERQQS